MSISFSFDASTNLLYISAGNFASIGRYIDVLLSCLLGILTANSTLSPLLFFISTFLSYWLGVKISLSMFSNCISPNIPLVLILDNVLFKLSTPPSNFCNSPRDLYKLSNLSPTLLKLSSSLLFKESSNFLLTFPFISLSFLSVIFLISSNSSLRVFCVTLILSSIFLFKSLEFFKSPLRSDSFILFWPSLISFIKSTFNSPFILFNLFWIVNSILLKLSPRLTSCDKLSLFLFLPKITFINALLLIKIYVLDVLKIIF